MRKVQINQIGGPEQLELVDAPPPQWTESELLVEVEAAGINYVDVYQRKGIYPLPLPYTPGLEGVGHIAALGSKVTGYEVGDRIAWVNGIGSYAEELVLPAAQAIKIPETFTLNEGLLFQAITAQYLLAEYRTILPGDTALVHAAAGGVGQLLVQWLKHLGARVIGTVSTDEKAVTVALMSRLMPSARLLCRIRWRHLPRAVQPSPTGRPPAFLPRSSRSSLSPRRKGWRELRSSLSLKIRMSCKREALRLSMQSMLDGSRSVKQPNTLWNKRPRHTATSRAGRRKASCSSNRSSIRNTRWPGGFSRPPHRRDSYKGGATQ